MQRILIKISPSGTQALLLTLMRYSVERRNLTRTYRPGIGAAKKKCIRVICTQIPAKKLLVSRVIDLQINLEHALREDADCSSPWMHRPSRMICLQA